MGQSTSKFGQSESKQFNRDKGDLITQMRFLNSIPGHLDPSTINYSKASNSSIINRSMKNFGIEIAASTNGIYRVSRNIKIPVSVSKNIMEDQNSRVQSKRSSPDSREQLKPETNALNQTSNTFCFQIPERVPQLKIRDSLPTVPLLVASPTLTSYKGLIKEPKSNSRLATAAILEEYAVQKQEYRIAPAAEYQKPKKKKGGRIYPDTSNIDAWSSFELIPKYSNGHIIDPCAFCEYKLYYQKYKSAKKQSRKIIK
jgi:hypothetical protein